MAGTSVAAAERAVPALAADLAHRTVGECMITAPKALPLETTIEDARAEFEDSHVHMLLLARDDTLHGTLLRSDLPPDLPPGVPPGTAALDLATLHARTVGPDVPVAAVYRWLVRSGQRRLAVVDTANTLLGLLCLKRSQTGFCTDDGVAARAREKNRTGTGTP